MYQNGNTDKVSTSYSMYRLYIKISIVVIQRAKVNCFSAKPYLFHFKKGVTAQLACSYYLI